MAIVSCGELALAASDSGLAIPSLVLVLVGLVLVLVAKMRALVQCLLVESSAESYRHSLCTNLHLISPPENKTISYLTIRLDAIVP